MCVCVCVRVYVYVCVCVYSEADGAACSGAAQIFLFCMRLLWSAGRAADMLEIWSVLRAADMLY